MIERYQARTENPQAFALRNRVLLLVQDAVGINVALAAIPFEERAIERSSSFEFLPHKSLRTCSAEDSIVYKAFADRPRDWVDIEGIVVRQGSDLDVQLIEKELGPRDLNRVRACALKVSQLQKLDLLRPLHQGAQSGVECDQSRLVSRRKRDEASFTCW